MKQPDNLSGLPSYDTYYLSQPETLVGGFYCIYLMKDIVDFVCSLMADPLRENRPASWCIHKYVCLILLLLSSTLSNH